MVSTRSTRSSSKRDAPTTDNEVPVKKQKVAKGAAKASKKETDGPEPEKEEPKGVTISQEPDNKLTETNDAENGKAENGHSNKEEANAPEADTKNGNAEDKSEYSFNLLRLPSSSPVLEKGVFYFFFRPRVNVEEVNSMNDVQKAYLLLRPTKSSVDQAQKNVRIIQIPKKVLPKTGTHERFLGFVINNDEDVKNLKDDIGESTYSTATRGERPQPAARPVGEGVYAISGDSSGRTSHFAYLLTLPAHATVISPRMNRLISGCTERVWLK